MTALWILEAYVVLGVMSAGVVLVRQRTGGLQARLGQALLAVVLWPFVLTLVLAPEPATHGKAKEGRSARAQRLEEVVGRLEACWRQAAVERAWGTGQGREHELMDRFIGRLRTQQRRLEEMEAALAAAPASVKERLARLYEHAASEHEHSIGLMEDLSAQLTLLRFSDLGNPAAARVERGHIEELLLRIEALAEASQPLGGAAAG